MERMKLMLVGAGAVGECILKVLKYRDPEAKWLEEVLVCDYSLARAEEVVAMLGGDARFTAAQLNALDFDAVLKTAKDFGATFMMDGAPPFACDTIFDAAFAAGADYGNMGTWSEPLKNPAYGVGIENSYNPVMTSHNFDNHEKWREAGRLAVICMGIDPGVVDVFAKYAATELFDELHEIHVKDGGNLGDPNAGPDDIVFGFSVWTVLDEVMNPNVEYDESRGGFIVEPAFAGEEVWEMPEGVGPQTMVKVEHEETVIMPRYLKQYGLKRCSFKIGVDDNLRNALKVIDKLGLRSLEPVKVNGVDVVPRDVVAACAPPPQTLGAELEGMMLVGIHVKGVKDGIAKEYFIYQPFPNDQSMERWGAQAVVAQTGFGAALSIELIGRGIWKDAGVYSNEYFDPKPYLDLMDESGFEWKVIELTPKA